MEPLRMGKISTDADRDSKTFHKEVVLSLESRSVPEDHWGRGKK